MKIKACLLLLLFVCNLNFAASKDEKLISEKKQLLMKLIESLSKSCLNQQSQSEVTLKTINYILKNNNDLLNYAFDVANCYKCFMLIEHILKNFEIKLSYWSFSNCIIFYPTLYELFARRCPDLDYNFGNYVILATYHRRHDILIWLLSHPDINNNINEIGFHALVCAMYHGDECSMRSLLNAGASSYNGRHFYSYNQFALDEDYYLKIPIHKISRENQLKAKKVYENFINKKSIRLKQEAIAQKVLDATLSQAITSDIADFVSQYCV
jgi:hypothetical protein